MKSDLHGAAERALAILQKLDEHEGNASADDNPDAVMAVRFALLDGARKELTAALHDPGRSERLAQIDARLRTNGRKPECLDVR
jgi:hypothetical protein